MGGISGNGDAGPALGWSTAVGKRLRLGTWEEKGVSTVARIADAVAGGRREEAAQLVDYFVEEARVCHVIYRVWRAGFDDWLATRGVPQAELAAERSRLADLLAFPDGAPFDPGPRWLALGALAGRLGAGLRGLEHDDATALAELSVLRESWRQLHDRWADWMSGQLTFVADRFGEEAVGDCYRAVLAPYLEERYAPFDVRLQPYAETVERNLELAIESMRAHLCGPDRMGDVDVDERADRYVLSFDPCGSGARGQRGDPIEGTPSRSEPPYSFAVTTEPHDWAGNEVGVCLYCAHCVFALELWPMEQWGHPIRTIDPPLHPAETVEGRPEPCRWTIWKSLEDIPDEAYARVGRSRPPSAEPG